MAKTRSPSYPAISLGEAIERVRLAYNRDHQNKVPRDVLASHMGYSSLSGASLPVLSALSKYGLIEGRGSDTRVSDLAVAIIAHPPGTREYDEAVRQAAAKPELFAELDKRFPNGNPSDVAIRSYLLTHKFIPAAADAVIRAYRETKMLVAEAGTSYDGPPEQVVEDERPLSQHLRSQQTREPTKPVFTRLSEGEAYQLNLVPGHLRGTFDITDLESADEVIRAINAWKVLFRPAGRVKRPQDQDANPDPPNTQPTEGHAEPERTSISFMITQREKIKLRELGYSEEEIRDMKPEDAHRALGLIR